MSADAATSPDRWVLLYDGRCVFCTRQSRRLIRLARPGAIILEDFRAPGVLDRFPQISPDAAERAMQLVTPDGRVFSGFQAAMHAAATRRGLAFLGPLSRLWPIRPIGNIIYTWIARNRYRFGGTVGANEPCTTGACKRP